MAHTVKNLPANAGDPGSSPASGRSPGEGNGNPLQYSCLENPMGRGAWRSSVHGVTLSRTRLKRLSMHDWGNSRALGDSGRAGLCAKPGTWETELPASPKKAVVLLTQKIIGVNLHGILHMPCFPSPTTGDAWPKSPRILLSPPLGASLCPPDARTFTTQPILQLGQPGGKNSSGPCLGVQGPDLH